MGVSGAVQEGRAHGAARLRLRPRRDQCLHRLGAKKHLDVDREIDIIDVNGGNHGQPFATNFNPEINIREVTADCRHWENGQFVETAAALHQAFDFPDGVGPMNIYRIYHEELESLVKHIPTIKKAQFWMTFSDNYLKHLEVLQNVGMTRIDPVEFNGQKIVPLQFLKAVLPDPGDLGPLTKGKTCIGVIAGAQGRQAQAGLHLQHLRPRGLLRGGRVAGDQLHHRRAGDDRRNQMLTGKWHAPGVWNMEQFDPELFLEVLAPMGLPTVVVDGGEWPELYVTVDFTGKGVKLHVVGDDAVARPVGAI